MSCCPSHSAASAPLAAAAAHSTPKIPTPIRIARSSRWSPDFIRRNAAKKGILRHSFGVLGPLADFADDAGEGEDRLAVGGDGAAYEHRLAAGAGDLAAR